MSEVIGFQMQRLFDGACGKYALQHALLLLGMAVGMKELNKATGLSPGITKLVGTSEEKLKRAIRKLGCTPMEYSYADSAKARSRIDEMLLAGYPVILAVDESLHWTVLAGRDATDNYFWIDSADLRVIGSWSWKQIVQWIDDEEVYFLAIKPSRGRVSQSIVPQFQSIRESLRDRTLRDYWGYYLGDLLDIFGPGGDMSTEVFFRKYEQIMLDVVSRQYLCADREYLMSEMQNYRTVAVAHRLTLSATNLDAALCSMTAALTCLAVGLE